MVHPEGQENGQKEAKRSRHEEEDEQQADEERTREMEEKMDTSFTGTTATQSPSETSHDAEINTGNGSHHVQCLLVFPELVKVVMSRCVFIL